MDELKLLSTLLRELTILYVEDDLNTQQTISEILNEFAKEVKLATNGKEALKIYNQENIDIIITDIEMPLVSGLEFIQKVRELDKETPVIMLSAYTRSDYLLSSIDLGIDAYIVKPISYTKIKNALQSAVRTLNINSSIYVKISNNLSYDKLNGFLIDDKNEQIILKRKEIDMMNLLLENKNNLVPYSTISEAVWSKYDKVMTSVALRTVVKKLRGKTDIDFIQNVSGLGYKINVK